MKGRVDVTDPSFITASINSGWRAESGCPNKNKAVSYLVFGGMVKCFQNLKKSLLFHQNKNAVTVRRVGIQFGNKASLSFRKSVLPNPEIQK